MAAGLLHRRGRPGFRPFPKGPRPAGLRFRVRRCERKSSSRQDGGGVAVRAPGASAPAVAPAASKEAPGLHCGVLPCPCDPSRGALIRGHEQRRSAREPVSLDLGSPEDADGLTSLTPRAEERSRVVA